MGSSKSVLIIIGSIAAIGILAVAVIFGMFLMKPSSPQPARPQPALPAESMPTAAAPTAVPTVAAPTPTAVPPTALPVDYFVIPDDLKKEVFSSESVNTTRPDDIQEEIKLKPWGMEPPFCMDDRPNLSLEVAPKSVEIFKDEVFLACGWQPDEEVEIALTGPDGIVTKDQGRNQVESFPGILFTFKPTPDNPLGKYSLTFTGASGSITHNFEVTPPIEPKMIALKENTYYLHGFSPDEALRIIAYRQDGQRTIFAAWKAAQADSQGRLMIEDTIPSQHLFILGEKSGAVWKYPLTPPVLTK